MSKTGCIISHEGIEYLCGLIRDINGLDTNLIDDLNIKSNGTFSSVRINTLLNALKTDCNDYTFSLVSNLSRLELKVVTDEADMVEHNKLYLIKKAGETSYSQYVIVTNDTGVDEKILLGTCDISMTDYLKITDADSTYCKKTDLDTTNNVLSNHINDTDIHVSTTDKEKWNKVDNKVDKTDITTTIDETSTDSELPTAKSVWDNIIKNNNIKTYYLLSQLGITTTCTIKDIWDKMPVNSIAIIDTNSSIVTDLDVIATALNITEGVLYGFLTIGKFRERTILEFRRSHTISAIPPETFIGYCVGGSCTSIQWKKMILCSIDGANKVTTITFSDTTNYKQHSGIELKYYTFNGVCYVSGGVDCVTPSSSLAKLATISKPKFGYVYAKGIVVNNSASDNTLLTIYIDGSGRLQFQNGLAGGSYRFTFSYPVSES